MMLPPTPSPELVRALVAHLPCAEPGCRTCDMIAQMRGFSVRALRTGMPRRHGDPAMRDALRIHARVLRLLGPGPVTRAP